MVEIACKRWILERPEERWLDVESANKANSEYADHYDVHGMPPIIRSIHACTSKPSEFDYSLLEYP